MDDSDDEREHGGSSTGTDTNICTRHGEYLVTGWDRELSSHLVETEPLTLPTIISLKEIYCSRSLTGTSVRRIDIG